MDLERNNTTLAKKEKSRMNVKVSKRPLPVSDFLII